MRYDCHWYEHFKSTSKNFQILTFKSRRWLQAPCAAIWLQDQRQQQEVIPGTSTQPSSYISPCRCLLSNRRITEHRLLFLYQWVSISRTAGKVYGITVQEILVHFGKRAEIPFSFAVTFEGQWQEDIYDYHDSWHFFTKLQLVFHFSVSLTFWSDYHFFKTPMNQDTTNLISGITLHIIDLAQPGYASLQDGFWHGQKLINVFCVTYHRSLS